jgi:hypothetical protein
MLQTGWLDESSYGLKTTVEMPAGPMRLAEFLCSLKEGGAEQLGGLVVEVRNAIRAVREKPAENALGLSKAAQDAARFGRYLRSVLAALREVDRQVLSSETLADRLRHYFEDFVERVLLRDYTSIATTAHPYRYRRAILASLDALEDSEIDLAAVADAYLEARLVPDAQGARDLVHEDLFRIRRVLSASRNPSMPSSSIAPGWRHDCAMSCAVPGAVPAFSSAATRLSMGSTRPWLLERSSSSMAWSRSGCLFSGPLCWRNRVGQGRPSSTWIWIFRLKTRSGNCGGNSSAIISTG